MTEIDKQNPNLSSKERKDLKSQLTSIKSIDGISTKEREISKLNKNFKMTTRSITNIDSQARNIKSKIQSKTVNFVKGKIAKQISGLTSKFRFV